VITKEWLGYEIGQLERELTGAKSRMSDAVYSLGRAEVEFESAKKSVETIEGCIRGLKDELFFLTDKKP
jgi:hypothetical protein